MSQPYRLGAGRPHRPRQAADAFTSTAAPIRAIPATRWPRRCSPTACGWSAAASSIIARAASSRPGPRSPTRWSSCAPARGASPTRAPPSSSCTTAWRRRARTAGRRSAFDLMRRQRALRALPAGRLLLQDLHVAALVLGAGLRADDPPHGGPRPRRARARSGRLRAHARPLRRAGRRLRRCGSGGRARRGRDRRARHPRRAGFRARRRPAARCAPRGAGATSMLAALAAMPRGARPAAHDRLRRLRPQRAGRGRARRRSSARAARASACASATGSSAPGRSSSPPAPSSASSPFPTTIGPA